MKILVDMMNVLFISFYVTQSELRRQGVTEFTDENIPFFLHFLFNKMNVFFSEYGKLDICWDGRNSLEWRRSVYPDYKRNRDKRKEDLSYKTLMSTLTIVEEGLKLYPSRQINVDKVEADDIIFALAEKYKDDGVFIVSSDKDLIQICNFYKDSDITVYNPIKQKTVELNENILAEKAIVGDPSDNIKGLFRIGIKTFEKMLTDKDLWNKKMSEKNNKQVFEALLKIIDLREFPQELKQSILDKEENLEYNTFNPDLVELFFWEHKLKDLLDRWPKIKNNILEKVV